MGKRQGQQLERLQRALEALEDGQQRYAERSHVMHLEELVRSQQSQQQQFCADLQALWAEVSRQRSPAEGANTVAAARGRTGQDRTNVLAANVLLRNIYSAVSELP